MSKNLSFVITAAGSDLGRSLAEVLLEDSQTSLLLTTRKEYDFRKLEETGRVLHCPNLDLANEQDISTLASETDRFFKTGFHVVNCVGYFPGYSPLSDINVSEARRIFESNLLAVYAVAFALLPLMQTRGGGHFMAFSSHTDYQSYPLMAAFTSAKAGLETLIRSIAHEYSKDKIIANTLAVATLATETEKKLKPHGDHENWLQLAQVSRLIRELVENPFSIMNGNTIHLYNHSDSFFHQSYFERISSEE
jgi:3-oxoacyl-[acyl-carrier protein] reductase